MQRSEAAGLAGVGFKQSRDRVKGSDWFGRVLQTIGSPKGRLTSAMLSLKFTDHRKRNRF